MIVSSVNSHSRLLVVNVLVDLTQPVDSFVARYLVVDGTPRSIDVLNWIDILSREILASSMVLVSTFVS